MKAKLFSGLLALGLMAGVAQAGVVSGSYGWENSSGKVEYSKYGKITVVGVASGTTKGTNGVEDVTVTPAEGSKYLHLQRPDISKKNFKGSNIVFAKVTGIKAGDVITVTGKTFDVNPKSQWPKLRFWFGKIKANNSYGGGVKGKIVSDYSDGTTPGWVSINSKFTVSEKDVNTGGIGIQFRIYPNKNSTKSTADFFLDDVTVSVNNDKAAVAFAGKVIPEPASLALFGLGAIAVLRRRR